MLNLILNLNKNKSQIKSKSDLATLSKVIYSHTLQNHEIQYFYHGIQYFIKKWPLENFGYSGYHDYIVANMIIYWRF